MVIPVRPKPIETGHANDFRAKYGIQEEGLNVGLEVVFNDEHDFRAERLGYTMLDCLRNALSATIRKLLMMLTLTAYSGSRC